MANYYQVTGYKHTGFDVMNRPFSRAVLEDSAVTADANRCQVAGIAVNRQDMRGITSIVLQGSIKDLKGEQLNEANITGSQGPGGPYYSWEDVDYIRLVRTGYPGDEDFIDISGHESAPWEAATGGRKALRVAYYFVTGLEPLARNTTRVYLLFDAWTSCGAADELIIDAGWKIRGHITDAEDVAGFNMASEDITAVFPLETISSGVVGPSTAAYTNIVCSASDLTKYTSEDSISAIVATATNGQTLVFPKIEAIKSAVTITIETGLSLNPLVTQLSSFGFFNGDSANIKKALSVLYSAGVLDVQASYIVPVEYVALGASGTSITNTHKSYSNPTTRDIGTYPRKADYLFGKEVILSRTSGNSVILPFSDVTDRTVAIWSLPTPNGYPVARFKTIKNHPHELDQIVQGLPWTNSSIILEGASGSFFNQAAAYQNQASNALGYAQNTMQYANNMTQQGYQIAGNTLNLVSSAATGAYGLNLIDLNKTGGEQKYNLAASRNSANLASNALSMMANGAQINAQQQNQAYVDMAYKQATQQNITNAIKASLDAPYASFIPDFNNNLTTANNFLIYVVNTGSKDRERLKTYFKRFGYSGLYEKLTFANINVKQKVNYIQAEGVSLRHSYYAKRDLYDIQSMFATGVFLWNTAVSAAAFDDNPDR